jgi:hypothetical protein
MKNYLEFIDVACELIGRDYVLTSDLDAYAQDWRKKFFGRPLAVLRPGFTEEVAALVRLCAMHSVAIVPQGAIPECAARRYPIVVDYRSY